MTNPIVRAQFHQWVTPSFAELCGRDLLRVRNAEKMAMWRAANPDKAKAAWVLWQAENPEKVTAARKRYEAANREKLVKKAQRWRANNPDKYKESQDRRTPESRAAHRKSRSEWGKANPNKRRLNGLLYQGCKISLGELESILARGSCEICGGTHLLGVDHDHATGAPRGLLCRTCNSGIGHLRDSEALLEKALNYLRRSGR